MNYGVDSKPKISQKQLCGSKYGCHFICAKMYCIRGKKRVFDNNVWHYNMGLPL